MVERGANCNSTLHARNCSVNVTPGAQLRVPLYFHRAFGAIFSVHGKAITLSIRKLHAVALIDGIFIDTSIK